MNPCVLPLLLACMACMACGTTLPALAQQTSPYPAQPVRLVVGFAAGGPSDLVARAFADQAGKSLRQAFVVENKPGANAFGKSSAMAERLHTAGLEPHTVCGDAFTAQIVHEIGVNQRLAQAPGLKAE